jgi:hypothetical protein
MADAGGVAPTETSAAPFERLVRAGTARLLGASLPAPYRGEIDAELVAATVVEHGLAALVAPVAGAALERCPEALGSRLNTYAAVATLHATLLITRTAELSALLAGDGLPHLVLKGAALAAHARAGWPPRQASDVDLLLADEGALVRACELFVEAGFAVQLQLPWEVHLYRAADGTVLDLHRHVTPDHLPRPFGFAELWDRRVAIDLDGCRVATTGRADTFVLLCLHLFKDVLDLHSGVAERVRYDKVVDLARFADAGDWGDLVAHAARLRCRRIALLALDLADGVAGLDLPAEVHTATATNPLRRAFPADERWLLGPGSTFGEIAQIQVQLRLRDRLIDRAALLITPTAEDRRALSLPPLLAPLHLLLRPLRLAAKGARALASGGRGL